MAKKTSIGGQALLEGIMMRGPEKTAMAVRHISGEMKIEEFETQGKDRSSFCKLPFIRGLFNMYDSLSFGYKCLMRSAELSGLDEEEEQKKAEKNKKKGKNSQKWDKLFEKLLMPIATVLAVALALVLFMWLPMQLWKWIIPAGSAAADSYFLRACFEGVLRIIIFIGYVWATSLMKDIRRTYMYHGAEHKTIFCYEAGLELTVENVRKQSRFHPRCGTSFMFVVVMITTLVMSVFTWNSVWMRLLLRLAMVPVVVGISYEINRAVGRMDNIISRIATVPGLFMQRFTTVEPDDYMIEVAIDAIQRVIPEGEDEDKW